MWFTVGAPVQTHLNNEITATRDPRYKDQLNKFSTTTIKTIKYDLIQPNIIYNAKEILADQRNCIHTAS